MMEVNFELIDEGSPIFEIFRFLSSVCDAMVEYEQLVLLIWRIFFQWLLISSRVPSNDQIFLTEWFNRHDLPQGPQ